MPTEFRTRLDSHGRIIIPAQFRKELGIKPGDVLIWRLVDGELRITTFQRRIERAQRLVRKYIKGGVCLSDELIAERRAEAMREQD